MTISPSTPIPDAGERTATDPRPLTVHDICLSYLDGGLPYEVYRQLEQIYDYLVAVRRHLPEGQDIELFWTATP